MSDTLDTHELDDFAKELLKMANADLPKESKKFMQQEGNKLKKATLSRAKSSVIEDTGEYFKGIKRGKVYKYGGKQGNTSVRVYGNYVAHLLEYGHRQVTHKKQGKKEVGFVPGFHIFQKSAKEFENKFNADCEEFIQNTVIKRLAE